MSQVIPEIFTLISSDLIKNIEKIFKKLSIDLSSTIFISDKNIWQNNLHFFSSNFLNKFANHLIIDNPRADENCASQILNFAKNHKFIVAMGSGTINDLCKYVSWKLNNKYLIIASAMSMNGYASKTSSITINEHKKTISTTLPMAILTDYKILQHAPIHMNKAGLADVLCFYSCNIDLLVNKLIFLQKNHQKAIRIQQKMVNNFVKNYQKYQYNDKIFLKKLFTMIITSGYAMTIADSSSPASQSEHLIAHVLTMKYPQKTCNYLHGEIIANTTILAMQTQEKILNNFINISKNSLNIFEKIFDKNLKNNLISYFNDEIAIECIKEIELKQKYFLQNKVRIVKNFSKNFLKIHDKLQKNLISNKLIIKIFYYYDIDYSQILSQFSAKQIADILKFASLIRARLTMLDLD